MTTLGYFTPSQVRAFKRAAATPDCIVLGQIVMTENAAAKFCAAGLWERFTAEFHSKPVFRYRFTAAGRAALSKAEPTP